jgi:hypothetical protein
LCRTPCRRSRRWSGRASFRLNSPQQIQRWDAWMASLRCCRRRVSFFTATCVRRRCSRPRSKGRNLPCRTCCFLKTNKLPGCPWMMCRKSPITRQPWSMGWNGLRKASRFPAAHQGTSRHPAFQGARQPEAAGGHAAGPCAFCASSSGQVAGLLVGPGKVLARPAGETPDFGQSGTGACTV